ncbi:sodium-coupled neutral amino acid symporter 2-like [Lampetra fluviatilis]
MAKDQLELRSDIFVNDNDSRDSGEDGYPVPSEADKVTISQYDEQFETESANFLNGGVKKYDQHEGRESFGMSVFNLSNAIMGSGILGLSFAMANTGILLFIVLLFGVAVLSLYSVHLLLVTSDTAGTKSYEQLGFLAFKLPGKLSAAGAITLQNVGAMSSYLFIVKYELPAVIRALCDQSVLDANPWYLNGNYLVILVSIAIILPLSLMKNIGYLGYTSTFSLACMVFFQIVIIYKKFTLPCPFEDEAENVTFNGTLHGPAHGVEKLYTNGEVHGSGDLNGTLDDSCTAKYFVFNSQTAYAVPILAFAFVCHPEVLPIYTELKRPTRARMQQVSNISIFFMFIMYLLTAVFGYLTFYENVEPELLHTFLHSDPYNLLIMLVRLAVLVAVTLTVPIVLFPIRSSVEELLFKNKQFNWIRHIAIALCLLVFVNILVIFVPTIRDIFGFIGASAATMLIFILPSAFYIKIVKKYPFKSKQKIGAFIFLVSGIFFMFASMGLIISDWVQQARGAH